MGQPIKKKIQEVHEDLIKGEPIYTLLVDGNSLLFMCMRDEKKNADDIHYGGIYQFLLQLRMQISKKTFDYVYVFFDDEYSGYLRWELYKPYKANRDKHYEEYGLSDYMKQYNANLKRMQDYIFNKNKKGKEYKNDQEKFIDENFVRERDELCRMFNELYIRWEIDDIVEGDDMIAYYCINKKPNEKIVILSGDMDIMQLIAEDICVYNLHLKKYVTPLNFKQYYGYYYGNTMIKKVFTGDNSDNISNIAGLSENKFFEIMPEAKEREVTINEVKERAQELINKRVSEKKKPLKLYENIINGVSNKKYDGDFYEINEKIINLKKPLLSEEAKKNFDDMRYAPQDPTDRSFQNLYKIVLENGIDEISSDTHFSEFFRPFKKIEEKELKRYNESL